MVSTATFAASTTETPTIMSEASRTETPTTVTTASTISVVTVQSDPPESLTTTGPTRIKYIDVIKRGIKAMPTPPTSTPALDTIIGSTTVSTPSAEYQTDSSPEPETTTVTTTDSTTETSTSLLAMSTSPEPTMVSTADVSAISRPRRRRRVMSIQFGEFEPVEIQLSESEDEEPVQPSCLPQILQNTTDVADTVTCDESSILLNSTRTEPKPDMAAVESPANTDKASSVDPNITSIPTPIQTSYSPIALSNGEGTTSEEGTICGTPRSGDITQTPVENYIRELVNDGPKWQLKPVNYTMWESIYNHYVELALYQQQIDPENGRLYPQPTTQIQPGTVYPTGSGDIILFEETTWMRPRPIHPQITYRQYHTALASKPMEGLTDQNYLQVKTSDINSDFLLQEEYLMLELLHKSRVPATLPVYLSGTPPGFVIEARFNVQIVPRGPSLYEYMATRSRADPVEIFSVARELLGLLSQLHSYGIAHGSFSGSTVVFGDKTGAPNLALTEFEVAAFLGTVDRSILVQSYRQRMNQFEMSPFELQGYRLSRRDDLFRWLEVVARMLYGPQFDRLMQREATDDEKLLEFKLYKKYFTLNGFGGPWQPWRHLLSDTKRQVKQILGVMLEYLRTLEIDEDPDYIGLDASLVRLIQMVKCAASS